MNSTGCSSQLVIVMHVVAYEYVTCGSALKLLNTGHNVRLHSHDVKYGSGSGQQVCSFRMSNYNIVICRFVCQLLDCGTGIWGTELFSFFVTKNTLGLCGTCISAQCCYIPFSQVAYHVALFYWQCDGELGIFNCAKSPNGFLVVCFLNNIYYIGTHVMFVSSEKE